MKGIEIFKNQEFGAICTMSNDQGELMFCAKDVCNGITIVVMLCVNM